MLKADFHTHSKEDPKDRLKHPARKLIDRAADLEFNFLALTLHERIYAPKELISYAEERGILMVPSVEARVAKRDVLVLNIEPEDPPTFRTWNEFRAYKKTRPNCLVIAPHPYYVLGGSLGAALKQNIDAFDAIEVCHYHTWGINPNHFAKKVAAAHNKPLVATSDAHKLSAFGNHFTYVDASQDWTEIRQAILDGKTTLVSPAQSPTDFFKTTTAIFLDMLQRILQGRRL